MHAHVLPPHPERRRRRVRGHPAGVARRAAALWLGANLEGALVREGRDLAWWHPLVSGDPGTVHEAGISVRGRVVSETLVKDAELPDHVVDWSA